MKHIAFQLIMVISVITARPARCATPEDESTDKRVALLIERMLKIETEQKAFSDLESLGCKAVPAIIRRMDDRRLLPDRRISLRNKSPDAFEDIRQYGPEEVVDAFAAILNQLTGQDFGFIYNGGTDEERRTTIQGWRKFLASSPTPTCTKGAGTT
jgi:hypothetical protein